MPCDTTKASSDIEHVDWSTGTGSGHHYSNVRFGSGSSQASQSSGDICRICHCESDPQNPLLTPCYCAGSLKYVHQTCLQQWLTASETNSCELCKFPFIMHTKIKPFNEWRSLDISSIERRRLCCSVLFHCAAALCVIWSLCVLIERAADDVQRGQIDWPFWTKLAVVTVGLTGGVVFMYIQCKAYLHLCHRWKARNRILLIQNAPEKVHPLSPPSPAQTHRGRNSNEQRSTAANNASGSLEVAANVVGAGASNIYSYANAPSIVAGSLEANSTSAALHHIHHLPASPHRLLRQTDLDIDHLAQGGSSSSLQQQAHQLAPPHHQLSQVAVAANIECPQTQNYERDWALDDVVSQISSFRPCPQGSGSMTPFHDSVHNVLEHSTSSSRASVNDVCGGSRQDLSTGGVSTDTGRSGDHKVPSISSGVSHAVANGLGGFVYKPHHTKRYSNSSIFLENQDMLDSNEPSDLGEVCDYPNINYRHSSILADPDAAEEQFEKFLGEDLRRYSDTKLLGGIADAEVQEPMLTNANDTEMRNKYLLRNQKRTPADTVLDMELPTSPLSPPMDNWSGQRPTLRRSMHTVEVVEAYACDLPGTVLQINQEPISANSAATEQRIAKARLFYKSLPNLSSSCESLIKK